MFCCAVLSVAGIIGTSPFASRESGSSSSLTSLPVAISALTCASRSLSISSARLLLSVSECSKSSRSRPAATSVSRSSGTFSTTTRIHLRRCSSLIRFFRILPRTTSRTLVFFRICIFLVAGIVVLVLVLVHVGHISHSTTRRRVPCFGLISSRAFRSSSGTIFIVRIFQHSRIFPVRRIFIRHAAGIFIASGGSIAVVEVAPFDLSPPPTLRSLLPYFSKSFSDGADVLSPECAGSALLPRKPGLAARLC